MSTIRSRAFLPPALQAETLHHLASPSIQRQRYKASHQEASLTNTPFTTADDYKIPQCSSSSPPAEAQIFIRDSSVSVCVLIGKLSPATKPELIVARTSDSHSQRVYADVNSHGIFQSELASRLVQFGARFGSPPFSSVRPCDPERPWDSEIFSFREESGGLW